MRSSAWIFNGGPRPPIWFLTKTYHKTTNTVDRHVTQWGKNNNKDVFFGKSGDWKPLMVGTAVQLSPRGFGRSSYHM